REYSHAPILVVAETHLVVREELVMIERVPLIDGAQAFDINRAVHDIFVHRPFEQVREQEGERNSQPLEPGRVMEVFDVHKEDGRAHSVNKDDWEIAVVPPNDSGAVLLPKIDLPLTDHPASPWPAEGHLIYHTCITASHAVQSDGRLHRPLDHSGYSRVPAHLRRLACKDYLTAFNDIQAVGEIRHVVDIRLGDEYRVAEGADIVQPLDDLRHDRWRQPFGRLGERQKFRSKRKRARDRHHLALAAREGLPSAFAVTPEFREQVVGFGNTLLGRPRVGAGPSRHGDIFGHSELAEHLAFLWREADAEPCDLERLQTK